jgi:hypothetical protein
VTSRPPPHAAGVLPSLLLPALGSGLASLESRCACSQGLISRLSQRDGCCVRPEIHYQQRQGKPPRDGPVVPRRKGNAVPPAPLGAGADQEAGNHQLGPSVLLCCHVALRVLAGSRQQEPGST